MGEFWFVVKTFLATVLLLFGLQIQVGGERLENRVVRWTQTSSVANFLQAAAEGGIKIAKNGYDYLVGWIEGDDVASDMARESNAQFGRLNLNLERSSKVKKEERDR